MKFGKRLLSAAAAGALLVTALTGCGGGQGSSPEPSVTLPDGVPADVIQETIEALQAEIQTIRADHSRQVLEMQQRHLLEKNETVTKHQTEVSRLNALLIKATEWFPWFRAMLRIEKLCLAVGFTHEQTAHLMTGKPLPYNGELYSDEHRRKFKTNDVTAKVGTNNGKLILAIDGLHIGEWFKKQFERLQQNVGLKPIQKKNKGFKL